MLNNPAYEITVLDRTPGPERGPVNYLVGDIQDFDQSTFLGQTDSGGASETCGAAGHYGNSTCESHE